MKQLRHLLTQRSPLRFSVLPSLWRVGGRLFFFVLLLSACTLSMEEWVETEEQKGYEDVETVENDFYTLKYEYKENTRSLTDEIQKYVAQVEADTILYFLDNTPAEWLPQLGGQVVSNCCEMFPMGLMGRVLSVEKTNGLIKVVTTGAQISDCYEEFDLDMDTDVFTSKPGEQTVDTVVESRATRGGDGDGEVDTVYRDWAMFRAIQSGQRQNRLTRTDLEDVYDEDVDKDVTEINEKQIYKITSDDILGQAIMAVSGKVNTLNITISSVNKTHMRKIVKLKKKREYTCTTSSDGIKLSSIMGVDLKKAATDKDKQSTAAKVAEWLRKPEMFPQVNKELDPKKKDFQLVIEIPIPNLPFGVIIRLKPVFEFDFGLYGDVEAVWWFSSSKTTTDIVNGKKVVDKSEKTSPPSNQFAFNAFGNFHVGGGAEAFLGLGKKVGDEAVGVGAFLKMTVDFNLNITPVTVGDYTLGSADEFCSITGNGVVGGKILTGGLFGDISFLETPFRWWDGVVWNYNPRVKFDSKFIATPDKDAVGDYYRHNMAYQYTSLGLNASSLWTKTRKPVLCVYESDDQDLDKPTEVLYDKSFTSKSKMKKNTRYEFTYKNYARRPIYVIPGVKGPNGDDDITLYKAYKTRVLYDPKPNIEYFLDYDEETKTYDYVYQDTDIKSPNFWYHYKWHLPFTLRNAAYINDCWDDWGIYNIVYYTPEGKPTTEIVERYTSLKNSITSSGKYEVTTKFEFYNPKHEQVDVQSGIYYVGKASNIKNKINDYRAREYSYHLYKYLKKDPGDILLKYKLPLSNEGGMAYPDGFGKFKEETITLKY